MRNRGPALAALLAGALLAGGLLSAESPAWSNEGPPFVVSALAVSADGVVYAGTQDGLYVSSDRGRSWVHIGPDLPAGRPVIAIAPDPVRPGFLYFAQDRDDGVFKSENYGRSRVRLPVGLHSSCLGVTRIAVAPSDSSTVYVSSGCGISRSMDGGATWTPGRVDRRFYSLAVHPWNPRRVLAGTDASGEPSSLIWASDDAGETWRPVAQPGLGNIALDIAFDPGTPDRVYAACFGVFEIARSEDAGETFAPSREGYLGFGATSIAVDPSARGAVYSPASTFPAPPELPPPIPDPSGVYCSANGGASWYRMPGSRPQQVLAIDPSGDRLYGAGGTPGVDVYDLRSGRPPIVRPSPAPRAPRTVVRPDGPVPKS